MTTEPQGPVYMCYDAALQEEPLARKVAFPPASAAPTPSPMAPDPAALRLIADKLLAASHPMLLAEYAGRRSGGFESMVALAETAGTAVWDVNSALNFPNKHPLCLSMDKASLRSTDLVVGLDVNDWEKQLTELDSAKRTREPLTPATCDFVEIGFGEINISKWAFDYCRMQPCSVRVLGDTALAIPELTRLCRERIAGDARLAERIAARKVEIAKRHDAVWAKWQEEARANWDASPITFARLALEIWEVIKHEDWVLAANNLKHQVRKLWDFDRPYRHPGVELGTATQIGISLGVALAHKGTGRIVVDIQPDGDLMFDAGALWIAAKYEIPMLVVMHNNRAYYNDWEHQIRMAKLRGTDEAKAHIGMDCSGPSRTSARLPAPWAATAKGRSTSRRTSGPRCCAHSPRSRRGGSRWWIPSRSTDDWPQPRGNDDGRAQRASRYAGSRPFCLSKRGDSAATNFSSAAAAAGSFAAVSTPAEKVVIFCSAAGSGPTISMPATGRSSLICWIPISASPLATTSPIGVPGSGITIFAFIRSAMPRRASTVGK